MCQRGERTVVGFVVELSHRGFVCDAGDGAMVHVAPPVPPDRRIKLLWLFAARSG